MKSIEIIIIIIIIIRSGGITRAVSKVRGLVAVRPSYAVMPPLHNSGALLSLNFKRPS
jgi:hypothetical protein